TDLPPVQLLRRPADDLSGLDDLEGGFDVVVLNEVAQYLPSVEHLVRVLEGAVEAAAPGGFVFAGGLRSFPLFEAFHTSVALHQAPAGLPLAELRGEVRRRMAREKELLVDPELFTALAARLPRVSGLSVQLKWGRARNELTKFRYDVVLAIGPQPPSPAGDEEPGLDWDERSTLDDLRGLLAEDAPAALTVRGVPNARLRDDLAALELLRAGAAATA